MPQKRDLAADLRQGSGETGRVRDRWGLESEDPRQVVQHAQTLETTTGWN